MAAARQHVSNIHFHDAVTNLIVKLLLNPLLVGTKREEEKARLIDVFWKEHSDFANRTGLFNRGHIWIIAEKPDEIAWMWHKKYSVPLTEVLGKLACLVTSKILGIGTAERNWKEFKEVKSGKRINLKNEKAKKQAIVYGAYQQQNARLRKEKLAASGKMWVDADFECCKMGPFCKDILSDLEQRKEGGVERRFLAWKERRENKVIGPKGDAIFEAMLVMKYSGLQWLDPDDEYSRRTVHPDRMWFVKKKGNNHYCIWACKDDYNHSLPPNKQEDEYDIWETTEDFYECVCHFYDKSPQLNVKCHKKDGDCLSDEE